MIKRLLFSAMAVAAMAFSASADTYDLTDQFGGSGWGSSYDADTKTITFDDAWTGKGVWLTDFDASAYDEVVFECETTTMGFNVVVEYVDAETADNTSMFFPAGTTKAVTPLSAEFKSGVKQIYIQGAAAGTIVMKELYLQNEVVVDPSIPVVIYEGETEFASDWKTSLDLPASALIQAKFAAGDKLVFEYTAQEGNGFKLIYVNDAYAWTLLPIMATLPTYSEQHGTINLPTDKHELAITFDAENVDLLISSANHGGKVQAGGLTITKISVVHPEAEASASNWFISGGFNGWDNGVSEEYAFKATATEGVFEYNVDELSGEFLIVWSENATPDWSKKLGGVSNMNANTAYEYVIGGDNFSLAGIVKDATVVIDTNAGTITVNGTSAANEFEEVYLIGDFGDGWSETNTNMPLTLKEGTTDTFEGTYELTAATSYFKLKAGSFVFGTGGGDVAVELDTDYTAKKTGNAYSIGAGKYNFVCTVAADGETATLKVTAATDGIADITTDENAPVEYFNLQGGRVTEPTTGLYIRRQGGKAAKVYVK